MPELERSAKVDPRNLVPLDFLESNYFLMRSYEHASQVRDRRAALKPNGLGTRLPRACIDVASRANTWPLHTLLDELVTDDPPTAEYLAEPCFWLGVLERDPDAAQRALALATHAKKAINATPTGMPHLFRNVSRNLGSVLLHYLVTVKQQNNKTKRN